MKQVNSSNISIGINNVKPSSASNAPTNITTTETVNSIKTKIQSLRGNVETCYEMQDMETCYANPDTGLTYIPYGNDDLPTFTSKTYIPYGDDDATTYDLNFAPENFAKLAGTATNGLAKASTLINTALEKKLQYLETNNSDDSNTAAIAEIQTQIAEAESAINFLTNQSEFWTNETTTTYPPESHDAVQTHYQAIASLEKDYAKAIKAGNSEAAASITAEIETIQNELKELAES